MREQRVSSRYAQALSDIVLEQKIEDVILKDITFVEAMFNSSKDLDNLIKSPIVRSYKKIIIFKELLEGKVSEIMMRFITLITDKGREELILDIFAQYMIDYNERHKLLPVEFISAVELTDEVKAKTQSKISEITGMTILPQYTIQKELLGGFKINFSDIVFDASIKSKLKKLHTTLLAGNFSVN